jgi:hypothetical protein
MKLFAWTLACATLVAASSRGLCQAPPATTARRAQLIDQAFEANTRGNHSEAIRLGDEAATIQASPSLLMFLAEQHEILSRAPEGEAHMVEALSRASACVRGATEQTALNNRVLLLQRCGAIVDQMTPRVARVRIAVPRPAPSGMRLRVNGADVPESAWANPVVVLAGAVTIEAAAPTRGEFHRSLTVPAGRVEDLAVTFPIDAVAPAGAARSSVLRIVGLTLVGVGAVVGAVGVVQWASSDAQAQDALEAQGEEGVAWTRYNNEVNPRRSLAAADVCTLAALDAANVADAARASSFCETNERTRTLAFALGIGGAAMAVAGAAVAIISPTSGAPQRGRVGVAPMMGSGVAGATIMVRF